MSQSPRFFIALLPPIEVQQQVRELQQHLSDRYASQAAQKSPPHITLQPPFQWPLEEKPRLTDHLQQFSLQAAPLPVTLHGFAAFAPRVIYIHVLPSAELQALQLSLVNFVETHLGILHPQKQRPFVPHVTLAFRDLTEDNFRVAWAELGQQPIHFDFWVASLTLLHHDGQRWNVAQEFALGQPGEKQLPLQE